MNDGSLPDYADNFSQTRANAGAILIYISVHLSYKTRIYKLYELKMKNFINLYEDIQFKENEYYFRMHLQISKHEYYLVKWWLS